MIVEGFVGALTTVMEAIFQLIPQAAGSTMPDTDPAYFAYRMPAVRWVSAFVPLSAMVAAIGVLVTWWGACTVYRITIWALGALHIIGNGD